MSIDLHTIYRLKDDVLLAEFDTAGILFDLRSRRCLELNPTGLEAIGLLNGHDTLRQIIARLAAVYGQPEAHLQKDFEVFFTMLKERDLLDDSQGTKSAHQG